MDCEHGAPSCHCASSTHDNTDESHEHIVLRKPAITGACMDESTYVKLRKANPNLVELSGKVVVHRSVWLISRGPRGTLYFGGSVPYLLG